MTALLTDEAALEAAKAYSLQRHPKIGHRNTEVWPTAENRNAAFNDFGEGARFARSIYEARLAEDAKVRAGLVASLQSLVAAICKVHDWDGTRVGSALDDVEAALAAAKEIK